MTRVSRFVPKVVLAVTLTLQCALQPSGALAAPIEHTVPCPLIRQRASSWCWAACTEMIFSALGANYSQEQAVVSEWGYLNPTGTGTSGWEQRCIGNRTIRHWYGERVVEASVAVRMFNGCLPADQIEAQLGDRNSFIIAGVRTGVLTSHAIVINGYRRGENGELMLSVLDPMNFFPTWVAYDYLRNCCIDLACVDVSNRVIVLHTAEEHVTPAQNSAAAAAASTYQPPPRGETNMERFTRETNEWANTPEGRRQIDEFTRQANEWANSPEGRLQMDQFMRQTNQWANSPEGRRQMEQFLRQAAEWANSPAP